MHLAQEIRHPAYTQIIRITQGKFTPNYKTFRFLSEFLNIKNARLRDGRKVNRENIIVRNIRESE